MSAAHDFRTPRECARHRDDHAYRISYEAVFTDAERRTARGEVQVQCAACGRWPWPDDRCNLFRAADSAPAAHSEER